MAVRNGRGVIFLTKDRTVTMMKSLELRRGRTAGFF
ncbi:MAG: hypothetical protein ACI9YM_000367 [Brevundimonas sp.]|jgi:hypothetical protein